MPLSANNLKEIAYTEMKKQILNEELEPGVVYSERKFCTDLGVSRTPFHSALQQLEQEGYLDILPSRGFTLHRLTASEIEQTYEVRSAIEFYCYYRIMEDAHGDDAARRKSAEKQIRKLERSIADQRSIMESSHDIPEFLEVDYQFHEDAIGYLQNPTFDRDLDSITHNIRDLASSSLEHEGRMEKTVEEHQAILDAIKDGKTEALLAAAMRHFRVPKDINLQDVR